MAPTKERLHSLMHLFIACLLKLSTAAPCLPDQASSLLQLKASFIGDSLPSWQAGTDCCHHWKGVTCDVAFGRVISLDLGTIGRLVSLHGLDMSHNNFTGKIPSQLGRLPQGNQFLTFPSSSFEGNAGLYGIQLSKQCDNLGPDLTTRSTLAPEPNSLWQDRLDAIIFFLFVGLGFDVGFALSIIFRSFYHIEGWLYKHMY
ncbi:receptor-like protein 19 isoform X3 [Panicum hallii]|uniref:receptor-like protein 19 isoform X3 n=1 Tax=Panicum hallii TaxID=206008 RepID=UPI000DF4DC9D|nr:receptor-like protein 19 isoform X3 [Panicum hallii]